MCERLLAVMVVMATLMGALGAVATAQECDDCPSAEIRAEGWIYFIFSGPGDVHTVAYNNASPVDLRVGTQDCCILDDVVEKYVDGCLVGVHRSVDGTRTQHDWISLPSGNHTVTLVNTSSTVHASGWYYQLTTAAYTGCHSPCATKTADIFQGEYWCPSWPWSKDGDIDNDGRLDWFYEKVSDRSGTTLELWGIDPSSRLFDEYFAVIVNGHDLIGKCVYSGGRNRDWMVYMGKYDCEPGTITEVNWESKDEGTDDIGTAIWPGFTSVKGKDSLRFTYTVADNALCVTHYDEKGQQIGRECRAPAVPTHSWAWNGIPVAELQYEEGEYMTTEPGVQVDVEPDVLNLESQGKWITVYIELPPSFNVAEIDASTILLNGTVSPVLDPKYDFVTSAESYLTDHDNDGLLERMVKFDATTVRNIFGAEAAQGDKTLVVSGELADGTIFEETDGIRVR